MWGLAVVCLPLFFQMPVSCTTTAFASEVTDTTMRESNTNVTITIDSKGYYYITETMDITFYASYTEFLRDIPYKNTVYVQENGTVKKHTSYAQIRDVSASWEDANGEAFEVNTYIDEEGYEGYYTIGVKSSKPTTYGETRTYSFIYTYYPGSFEDYGYQGVYFNIIGHMASHERTNINFSITFPSNYHTASNNVMVYYGLYGSNDSVLGSEEENPQAYINTESETVITGYIQHLGAYEGVTVQVALPQNYFAFPEKAVWPGIVTYVVLAVAVVLCVLLYIFKLKSAPLVEPVEVTPPENLIPLKCGTIFKEKGTPEGVTSMLVYMANKGYISIEEKEDSVYLHKKQEITEKEDNYLQRIYTSLFTGQDVVSIDALPESFYSVALSAISEMNVYANHTLYANKKHKLNWVQFIPAIIAFFVCCIAVIYSSVYLGFLHVETSIIVLLVVLLVACVCKHVLVSAIVSVVSLIMAYSYQSSYYQSIEKTYSFFIATIMIVALLWGVTLLKQKYTKDGAVIKGRVNGFRKYLQVAEKSQLEMLVEENPNYFYDILPYTYALDVTDVWMEKFKDIRIQAPTWYVTSSVSVFDVMAMHYVLSRASTRVYHQIQSHVLEAQRIARATRGFSAGGGHGGGFSGGGAGGGGSRAR